jgi:hypothetical protein
MVQRQMYLLSGNAVEILRGRIGTAEVAIDEVPRIAQENETE